MNKSKIFKKMLFSSLTIIIFIVTFCFANEAKQELQLPKGNINYNEYKDAELIQIADLLFQFHRHAESVEACQKALNRNLSDDQAARAKHLLAQAYEIIPNRGQDAKDTYAQIIREHPNYEKLPDVAYRLGELNTSIVPKGTKPDKAKAIDYLKLVIERLPIEPAKDRETKVTYLSLEANMMLGNLYLSQKNNDEAKKCFKAIFDCDIKKVVALPYEKFKTEKEKQEQIDWLKEQITNMKKRIPAKLVASCSSADAELCLQKLSELQSEYPNNTEINELASAKIKKLSGVDEIVNGEIGNLNKK
jgi:tetratricopeptide (TPR) repeat protein